MIINEHPPPEDWDKRAVLIFLNTFCAKVKDIGRPEFDEILQGAQKLTMGLQAGLVPLDLGRKVIRDIDTLYTELTGEALL